MNRNQILAAAVAAVLLAALAMALTLEPIGSDGGWNGWRHTIGGE